MPPEAAKTVEVSHAAISDVVGIKELTLGQRLVYSQPFWIFVVLIVLVVALSVYEPAFSTADNIGNVTRNFALFGIMALGMTVVIITGGIDLSVGSIIALVAIVAGLFLTWEYPWYVAFFMGLVTGLICGAVNGFFVAYVGMQSFVVTLGMMAIARSLAIYFSGNKMLYQFGPDAPIVKAIGQARWPLRAPAGWAPSWMPEFSSHFWIMVLLALVVGFVFNFTAWARHLFAIGGNEQAARLTGVPVDRIKFQAYVFSAFTATVASLLLLGYTGSAINGVGQSYELRVIAGTVIGGANLMGGTGTAFGAIVGSALLEIIRNGLIMLGFDPNLQGAFTGSFIILAVLLGMQFGGKSIFGAALDLVRPKRHH